MNEDRFSGIDGLLLENAGLDTMAEEEYKAEQTQLAMRAPHPANEIFQTLPLKPPNSDLNSINLPTVTTATTRDESFSFELTSEPPISNLPVYTQFPQPSDNISRPNPAQTRTPTSRISIDDEVPSRADKIAINRAHEGGAGRAEGRLVNQLPTAKSLSAPKQRKKNFQRQQQQRHHSQAKTNQDKKVILYYQDLMEDKLVKLATTSLELYIDPLAMTILRKDVNKFEICFEQGLTENVEVTDCPACGKVALKLVDSKQPQHRKRFKTVWCRHFLNHCEHFMTNYGDIIKKVRSAKAWNTREKERGSRVSTTRAWSSMQRASLPDRQMQARQRLHPRNISGSFPVPMPNVTGSSSDSKNDGSSANSVSTMDVMDKPRKQKRRITMENEVEYIYPPNCREIPVEKAYTGVELQIRLSQKMCHDLRSDFSIDFQRANPHTSPETVREVAKWKIGILVDSFIRIKIINVLPGGNDPTAGNERIMARLDNRMWAWNLPENFLAAVKYYFQSKEVIMQLQHRDQVLPVEIAILGGSAGIRRVIHRDSLVFVARRSDRSFLWQKADKFRAIYGDRKNEPHGRANATMTGFGGPIIVPFSFEAIEQLANHSGIHRAAVFGTVCLFIKYKLSPEALDWKEAQHKKMQTMIVDNLTKLRDRNITFPYEVYKNAWESQLFNETRLLQHACMMASSMNAVPTLTRLLHSPTETKELALNDGKIFSCCFCPTNYKLAAAGSTNHNNVVLCFEKEGRISPHSMEGHKAEVRHVEFSHDGERIISSSLDGEVRLWDVKLRKCLKAIRVSNMCVWSATFSKDGSLFAATVQRKTLIGIYHAIYVYNTNSWDKVCAIEGHKGYIHSVSFGPCRTNRAGGGMQLASVAYDAKIMVWDLREPANPRLAYTLEGHTAPIRCVNFSPDGSLLVTGGKDKTARVWDTKTKEGSILGDITSHANNVNHCTFSPDGRTIATASTDMTVKLWTVTGECTHTLQGHSKHAFSCSFSPRGDTVMSGSFDGKLRFFHVHTKPFVVKKALFLVTRKLNGFETRIYSIILDYCFGKDQSPGGGTTSENWYDLPYLEDTNLQESLNVTTHSQGAPRVTMVRLDSSSPSLSTLEQLVTHYIVEIKRYERHRKGLGVQEKDDSYEKNAINAGYDESMEEAAHLQFLKATGMLKGALDTKEKDVFRNLHKQWLNPSSTDEDLEDGEEHGVCFCGLKKGPNHSKIKHHMAGAVFRSAVRLLNSHIPHSDSVKEALKRFKAIKDHARGRNADLDELSAQLSSIKL